MAYRFKVSEPLGEGVRRIAGEQLDKSIGLLTSAEVAQPVAVHEFRKCCKKIRALLRLARPALGTLYQAENRWYRDIAGALSTVRDAEVLVQAASRLRVECRNQETCAVLDELRDKLDERRLQISANWAGLDQLLPELASQVQAARGRLTGWAREDLSFALMGVGLQETYRKGSKAFRKALDEPTDDRWHDWRKRVKAHWYHMRLFVNAWPIVMGGRARELNLLGELLGEDHDLAVLLQTLEEEPSLCASAKQVRRLNRCVVVQRRRLRRKACRLGALVFAERPAALVSRLESYWAARCNPPA